MLGSSFFQEYTSGKREKGQKTYDHMAFGVDGLEDPMEESDWEPEETLDEEALGTLAMDDDASLVLQFENEVMDAIQDDRELATNFVSYQDARRRLMEKTVPEVFGHPKPSKGGRKVVEKASKANRKAWSRESPPQHAGCAANQDTGRPSVQIGRQVPAMIFRPHSSPTSIHACKTFPKSTMPLRISILKNVLLFCRAVANCVLIFVLAPMLRYSAPIRPTRTTTTRRTSTNRSRSDAPFTPLRSVTTPRIVLAPMLRYSAPIRYLDGLGVASRLIF